MKTDILFEPFKIGNVVLKNRIAMSPMNMGYTGPNGFASEQTNAWYATRARGGFGLIITECIVVNPYPWRASDGLNPLLADNQNKYRQLSQMVEVVHSYNGTKIFAQISPGWGRQGHPDENGLPAGAPSAIPLQVDLRNVSRGWVRQFRRVLKEQGITGMDDFINYDFLKSLSDEQYEQMLPVFLPILKEKCPEYYHILCGDTPRELTIREIEQLEDCMVDAVCHMYSLGFDGVELHTPHGYLLHQFLSPRSNQRNDLYGGSIENRGRVVTNIIKRVREKIGPDKPLGCRLSGDELMPNGLSNEDTLEFIKLFTEAGANFFNVSQGCYENLGAGFAPDGEDEFTRWSKGFKEASGNLPVITPNFTNPETAAKAILDGKTDIISLGRQSIADPYWPVKVKEGRINDIVKCVRCQQCYMNLFESKWIRCAVNPTAGFEKYYPELWQTDGLMDVKAKRFMDKCKNLKQI